MRSGYVKKAGARSTLTKPTAITWCAVLAVAWGAFRPATAQNDSFTGVGVWPGGTNSAVTGITTDGSVLCGTSANKAVIWSESNGLVALQIPANGSTYYGAVGVEICNGVLVVAVDTGLAAGGIANRAQRWDGNASGAGAYGVLPKVGGTREWIPRAVGTDGTSNIWIAGSTVNGGDGNGREAMRYQQSTNDALTLPLPTNVPSPFTARDHSDMRAVSNNGWFAGHYQCAYLPGNIAPAGGARNAMTWMGASPCQPLNSLFGAPGNKQEALIMAMSRNGLVQGGRSNYPGSPTGIEFAPVLWNNSATPTQLPFLAGGDNDNYGEVLAINHDGTIAGGYSMHTPGGQQEAFIWDPVNGTRRLQSVLVRDYCLDLSCWLLTRVTAISAGTYTDPDGVTLAGIGIHGGVSEGWVARIGVPRGGCGTSGPLMVCPDGSGCYRTIQAAIDAAADGDEIILCPQTHSGCWNRDLDFGGKAITVRGTDPDNPAVVAATVIDCGGSAADPHRAFSFHSGEDSASLLAGLTIRTGYEPDFGGAILCSNSSPSIRKCVIETNQAPWGAGGGIYCLNSNALITDCTIRNNASQRGGGMYNENGGPTLTRCLFEANVVNPGNGGGIFNRAGLMVVTDCTFADNQARALDVVEWGHGGGIFNRTGADAVLTGCTFTSNVVDTSGGGVHNQYSSPTLTRCTFDGNTAMSFPSSSGGAMSSRAGAAAVTNCLFRNNLSLGEGGALAGNEGAALTLRSCVLVGNSSGGLGGAIHSYQGSAAVAGCTFSRNSAAGGGALGLSAAGATVDSSIFWGDTAPQGQGTEFALWATSSLTFSYSDVQGGTGGAYVESGSSLTAGAGNLDTDPLFVDSTAEDYHIQITSACVDSGDPAYAPAPGETDMDDENRIQAGRVDMGADERWTPDTDSDGVPDYRDNCPFDPNGDQLDTDQDGAGDACDPCPDDAGNDADADQVCGDVDNCPAEPNTDQADADGDGLGNACEPCPNDPDNDADNDAVCGNVDNCPCAVNPDQGDADSDGVGDVCDNCPGLANPGLEWILRALTDQPQQTAGPMAYDAERELTVLFAGPTGTHGLNGETWGWNGATWTLLSDTGPAPRYEHAMAYDSDRGVIVMFGGKTADHRVPACRAPSEGPRAREGVRIEETVYGSFVDIVRITHLVGPRAALSRIRSIARLSNGEWRTRPQREDSIDLPVAENRLHRPWGGPEEGFAAAERQIVEPAQRVAVAEVLGTKPALLTEVPPILNRCALPYKGRITIADAFRKSVAGHEQQAFRIPLFPLNLEAMVVRITTRAKAVHNAEIRIGPPGLYRSRTRRGLVRQRRPGQPQPTVAHVSNLQYRVEAQRLLDVEVPLVNLSVLPVGVH